MKQTTVKQAVSVQEYDFQPSNKSVTVWYTLNGQPRQEKFSALDFHYFLWFLGLGIAHTGSIADYFDIAPTRQMVAHDLAEFIESRITEVAAERKTAPTYPKRIAAPLWLAHEEQTYYMRGLI